MRAIRSLSVARSRQRKVADIVHHQGVIDSSTQPSSFATSPFLAKAASTIARRSSDVGSLADEEDLLEEWSRLLPRYWHYDTETANSRDPVRITQAERLHCVGPIFILYQRKSADEH